MSDKPVEVYDLMNEIKYATALVRKKKYNLADYYNHMTDFFEYASMTADAEEHRVLATKWKNEKGDNDEN